MNADQECEGEGQRCVAAPPGAAPAAAASGASSGHASTSACSYLALQYGSIGLVSVVTFAVAIEFTVVISSQLELSEP